MDYRTGNATADSVGMMNFTGNVIPSVWFRTVVNDRGKPHLLAIMILSEIVYWYRPAEVRDEATGEFLGYKTKFKNDLLQKSYKSLAEHYQVSKRQVTDAVIMLEKLGVIKRVFRTVQKNGVLYNNVLFISLNPDVLREITYPTESQKKSGDFSDGNTAEESGSNAEEPGSSATEPDEGGVDEVPANENVDSFLDNSVDNITPITKKRERVSRKNVRGYPEISGDKYNRLHTKTTSNHSNLSPPEIDYLCDSFVEQIGYDDLRSDYGESECDVLDQCVDIATTTLMSEKDYFYIAGERRPAAVVKKQLRLLDYWSMRYVVKNFMSVTRKITKLRSYLLTVMIDAVYSSKTRVVNDFVRLNGV
jgi:hypothetical protein